MDVVKYLLEKGADPLLEDKNGKIPGDLAKNSEIQKLLEKAKKVELLCKAAMCGNINVVNDLLATDVSIVNDRNCTGKTALRWAARNDHKNVVELLLEQKDADINVIDDLGRTALHWAALQNHKDIVGFLVEKGADVKAVDNQGRTALDLAKKYGYTVGANAIVAAVAKKPSTQVSGTQEEQHTAQAGASKS